MSAIILHHYPLVAILGESTPGDGREGSELELGRNSDLDSKTEADSHDGRIPTHADPADRRGLLLRHPADPADPRAAERRRQSVPEWPRRRGQGVRLVDRERIVRERHLPDAAATWVASCRRSWSTNGARSFPSASSRRNSCPIAPSTCSDSMRTSRGWPKSLADGRKFLLGADPSAADLSAFHPIWFAHQNGGKEITDTLSFSRHRRPLVRTGRGHRPRRPVDMTPDQAIDAARTAEPRDLDEWSPKRKTSGFAEATSSA